MKKIGIISIASITCLMNASLVNAEPYLGVYPGAAIVTVSKEVNYLQTQSSLSDKFSGFRGQVLLGYDIHTLDEVAFFNDEEANSRDEFYVAIEIDGNYNAGSATEKTSQWFLTNDASVKEELRYSYDIFVTPKYRFNQNIIVFLGGGYTQAQLKVSASDTGGNLGVSGSHDDKLSGWTVKAGIEVPLSRCVSAVATYQFARYNTKTLTNVEPLTDVNVTAKYQPDVNSLALGVNLRL